jgi:hypothetical protein
MMYFYRHPGWGIGFKILMIVLIIAGGTLMARSAFQAGYLDGASAAAAGGEGAEITAPFYPHMKGYAFNPFRGSFLTILAFFFGGILLIKLITSVIGLVMFRKWKDEGGPAWENWMEYRFGPRPAHCGPWHHGGWGHYPYPPGWKEEEKGTVEENTEEKPS